ncbi:MAG: band 7 protein, partial [Planctomycetota bacterium]
MQKIISALMAVLVVVAACFAFHWTVNRVYVPQGQSLLLRFKGPFFTTAEYAKTGYWAQEGEVGVLEKLRGPGRHFYCPLWWERRIVDDVVIGAGQVGIVTCKLGIALPA